jgi:hypothetical protein
LRNWPKPIRRPRRIIFSLLRAILVVFFLISSARVARAQTQSQLPPAWNEAVHALSEKIAAALTPSRTFTASVTDISSTSPVDLAILRQALADQIVIRGGRSVEDASSDSVVQVTISQSADGFMLVAEIHGGGATQTAMAMVGHLEEAAAQPSPHAGIERKIVWQQSRPILDFGAADLDTSHTLLYVLGADRLEMYESSGDAQVLHEVRTIARLYASRDPRGRLVVTDATHVTAFVGGVRCDSQWSPSFAIECHDNAGQQWPVGPVSWRFDPSRNYFSGSMTFSNSLEAKFPAFYSAASPSAETSGQNNSRWVVAGIDGHAQLFEGSAAAVATFDGWGSDIATGAPACGSQWQVLVTGTGDWTETDRLQLYEIRDHRAIAAGQPLEVPGPVLALWPAADGKSTRVVVRNLESGLYEASIVTVSCGK